MTHQHLPNAVHRRTGPPLYCSVECRYRKGGRTRWPARTWGPWESALEQSPETSMLLRFPRAGMRGWHHQPAKQRRLNSATMLHITHYLFLRASHRLHRHMHQQLLEVPESHSRMDRRSKAQLHEHGQRKLGRKKQRVSAVSTRLPCMYRASKTWKFGFGASYRMSTYISCSNRTTGCCRNVHEFIHTQTVSGHMSWYRTL